MQVLSNLLALLDPGSSAVLRGVMSLSMPLTMNGLPSLAKCVLLEARIQRVCPFVPRMRNSLIFRSGPPARAARIAAVTIGRSSGWTARKNAFGFDTEFGSRPKRARLCSVVQRWPVGTSYSHSPVFVEAAVNVSRSSLCRRETSALLRLDIWNSSAPEIAHINPKPPLTVTTNARYCSHRPGTLNLTSVSGGRSLNEKRHRSSCRASTL